MGATFGESLGQLRSSLGPLGKTFRGAWRATFAQLSGHFISSAIAGLLWEGHASSQLGRSTRAATEALLVPPSIKQIRCCNPSWPRARTCLPLPTLWARPSSRGRGQWLEDSGSPQRSLPVAPMFIELGDCRAKHSPISANIGATSAVRCEEPESARHAPRRRCNQCSASPPTPELTRSRCNQCSAVPPPPS